MFASYEDGTSRAPCAFQTTLDGQLPDKQTRKTYIHLKARSNTVIVSVFVYKLKVHANSWGSYPLADMETLDNTLDQVPSIFVR